jgi:hypothetical protein
MCKRSTISWMPLANCEHGEAYINGIQPVFEPLKALAISIPLGSGFDRMLSSHGAIFCPIVFLLLIARSPLDVLPLSIVTPVSLGIHVIPR